MGQAGTHGQTKLNATPERTRLYSQDHLGQWCLVAPLFSVHPAHLRSCGLLCCFSACTDSDVGSLDRKQFIDWPSLVGKAKLLSLPCCCTFLNIVLLLWADKIATVLDGCCLFLHSRFSLCSFCWFPCCHGSTCSLVRQTFFYSCNWSLARPRLGRLVHNSIPPFASACSVPEGTVWQHFKDRKDRIWIKTIECAPFS